MWTYLIVTALTVQLTLGQQVHRYIRIPVAPEHKNECYDPAVDNFYNIGEEWGPKNANCKMSKCVKEKGTLFIDRIACNDVRKLVDFKDMHARHLFCRIAVGDRRKAFPGCCQQLVCARHENGKRTRVSANELPLLPSQETFEYL
ncbi:uncharacterized protein LOC119091219 [Pollicipes pollicipes]|uniref:uncharacterized protein LOC119091214 n=1 Tax=Pollicipes pollicipes TaxID=41117 RepID=UPI0018851A72|nr:uncharacterized protein LOC119091214 [Pollicipes pollicipes]XP_037069759.1 uncharacterized protein LOC119091219 [Pollicipes pollicipes]